MTISVRELEKQGTIKRADAIKVRIEDIHVEPGFNLRDLGAVDDEGLTFEQRLALLEDHIAQGGMIPPLEVRPRDEGGVWIVDGHRRQMAINNLDQKGLYPRTPKKGEPDVMELWVNVVMFVGNDADRLARVLTSQENQKLNPLERAEGYKRLAAFGWTPAQIAKKIGRSAEHVKSQLDLANSNTDVQTLVRERKVSASVAIQTVRKEGEKAGAVLGAAVAANGGKKATPKAVARAAGDVPATKRVDLHLWNRMVDVIRNLSQDPEPLQEVFEEADKLLKELEVLK